MGVYAYIARHSFLLLSGVLASCSSPGTFDVTYTVKRQFGFGEAEIEYTTSDGSLTKEFRISDEPFTRYTNVPRGLAIELNADVLLGEFVLNMVVKRWDDSQIVFENRKTCTDDKPDCGISFAAP